MSTVISVRIACHVHSDWSYDGKWSLQKIATAFSKKGYRVVMITEHDRKFDECRRLEHRDACRKASTDAILLIPGIEYSDPSNTIHFLVWGDVPFIGSGMESEKILAATEAVGGIVVFAHPSRKEAWRLFDPHWKDKILGIELWNRKTDGWAPSKDAWTLLEMTQVSLFVGMDFHDSRQFFPFATVLEVEPPITEAAILNSLRSRHYSVEVFGCSIKSFSGGSRLKALRVAECLRRKTAKLYRRIMA
jgi:hypothetical protein